MRLPEAPQGISIELRDSMPSWKRRQMQEALIRNAPRRRVRAPGDGEQLRLTRTALPLRLAWALTVHRSQGMSLGKLAVHLEKAFGPGMVYVALSRCTSLAGLQVVNMSAPKCDADVKRYYSFIEAEEAWLAAAHRR